jgi:hypothetical protein
MTKVPTAAAVGETVGEAVATDVGDGEAEGGALADSVGPAADAVAEGDTLPLGEADDGPRLGVADGAAHATSSKADVSRTGHVATGPPI